MRRIGQRGATTVEMTLVGIPLIFILISVFEISRGMWMYHTLAYAVKEGVRFASVHGENCVYNAPSVTNSCEQTEASIAAVIQQAGVGLDPAKTQLTFCPGTCGTGTAPTCSLSSCGATAWPPSGANEIGQTIEIDISVPFYSALAMFWPGSRGHVSFAVTQFGAASSDTIKF